MKKQLLVLLLLAGPSYAATLQHNSLGDVKVSDMVWTPTNYSITSVSSPIIPTSSFITIMSTGGNLILRGRPTISTTTALNGSVNLPNGFQLIIGSTATINYTLSDDSALSGTLLNLSGPGLPVVSSTAPIHLILSNGKWNQMR